MQEVTTETTKKRGVGAPNKSEKKRKHRRHVNLTYENNIKLDHPEYYDCDNFSEMVNKLLDLLPAPGGKKKKHILSKK